MLKSACSSACYALHVYWRNTDAQNSISFHVSDAAAVRSTSACVIRPLSSTCTSTPLLRRNSPRIADSAAGMTVSSSPCSR